MRVGQDKIYVMCDIQSTIHLTKNQVCHNQTKHINVHFYFVREIIEGRILLCEIGTADNSADILTKVVNGIKFQHCLDLIH